MNNVRIQRKEREVLTQLKKSWREDLLKVLGFEMDFNFGELPWWLRWQKRPRTMWETRVRSLVWEDTLEKEMASPSSTLAWKIPWTEEPGRLQFMGMQRVDHD